MPLGIDSPTESASKKEEIGAYRKKFLAEVSHELKTSVFLLQGYLDALNKTKKGLKKPQRRLLKRARKHAGLLAKLIEDILTASLMENGIISMHISSFCMHALCTHLIEDYEKIATEKRVHLHMDTPPAPQFVQADRSYMEQVVRNLLHNAIHYNQADGQVCLKLKPNKSFLLVSVSDTGQGISKEELPHIFDLFYRIEPSRNRETGGSGIGLSLVKHILKAHNQSIDVQSEVKKGTSFSFSLPLLASASPTDG